MDCVTFWMQLSLVMDEAWTPELIQISKLGTADVK